MMPVGFAPAPIPSVISHEDLLKSWPSLQRGDDNINSRALLLEAVDRRLSLVNLGGTIHPNKANVPGLQSGQWDSMCAQAGYLDHPSSSALPMMSRNMVN